uniref:Uncharacterized protein n=1 Tax=Sus scrofa TaxID=9823 RepID=A0A8D0X0H5_PIG
ETTQLTMRRAGPLQGWMADSPSEGNPLLAHGRNIISTLCCSPNRFWLCCHSPSIKAEPQCISLALPADGQTLSAGCSESEVQVWQVTIYTR